jgi:hypothetical protein
MSKRVGFEQSRTSNEVNWEACNMMAIDDQIDVQCQQCANDAVHIEKVEALPTSSKYSYLCRCGKCGWRFRVYSCQPVFIEDSPAIA